MSIINQNLLLTPEGYTISRSVRLRSSASPTFTRTPTVNGDSTKFTLSCWIKRTNLSINTGLMTCYIDPNNFFSFGYNSNQLWVFMQTGGVWRAQVGTTAVFRDPSSWYHVVMSLDTSGTVGAGTYLKIYINGVLQTLTTSVAPNGTPFTGMNSTSYQMQIGRTYAGGYSDQYLAEYYWIDGQVVAASAFGETDGATGVWKPKKYLGTYGTNGFYLNFSDNSAATAAAIGKDSSGNGNNFTPNNISVTAGATYDSMLDVPTPYADGGNGRGNYAVLNPLWKSASGNGTFYDGNLSYYSVTNAYWQNAEASIAVSSGKWYWEVVQTAGYAPSGSTYIGIAPTVWTGGWPGADALSYAFYTGDGKKYNSGTGATYGSVCVNGDVIGVALDLDSGTIAFYKNGSAIGTAYTGLSGTFAPVIGIITNSSVVTYASVNFGQRPFTYTPPTGFKALNTQNLPDSTIKKGNKYFDVTTYTGNGVNNRAITGVGFQPDLVWTKARSAAYDALITDAVRGSGKSLTPSSTGAEVTNNGNGYVSAFNADGFTLTQGASSIISVNESGQTYVGWQWKKGATQGFDIVTYTGNSANRTIAHSLGVAPSMVIVKNRSAVYDWPVYHAVNGATKYMYLNTTSTAAVASSLWNDTAPTSSVFSVGTSGAVNNSSQNYVAYLFSEVAGFSKFGSYTGNGSTDGPFVYCGFRPKFVITKSSDATAGIGDWTIHDTSRLPYNTNDLRLFANASSAESSSEAMDMLSNGFKIRATNSNCNTSGGGYIYAAFAENPFKNSLAR